MAEDINISPDMINNLVNMLKNSSSNTQTNASSASTIDSVSNENSDYIPNSSDTDTDSNNSTLDFETIMKIKSIMEAMNNKNDPNSKLLYSLKPYLRKSKQAKLDQYVNLLKITQVTGILKNKNNIF